MPINIARSTFTLLVSLGYCVAQAAPGECGKERITVEKGHNALVTVGRWLKQHQPETLKDFVCCLPEECTQDVLSGHSSVAGQPGHSRSPRLILSCGADLILSLNGGDTSLPKADSVEVMVNNESAGQVEYYELDFSKRRKDWVSPKNPQECMTCHNGGSPVNNEAGPHTIFEPPGVWARFAHGINPSCPDEVPELLEELNQNAQNALIKHPVNCLDDASADPKTVEENLFKFDLRMLALNARRTAKLIRATPNYEKYKFAIAGILACAVENQPSIKLARWIPAHQLKQFDNVSTLRTSIRSTDKLYETARVEMLKEFAERRASFEYQKKILRELRAGKNPHFNMYTGSARCQDEKDYPTQFADALKGQAQGHPLIDKFMVDTYLRSTGQDFKFLPDKMFPLPRTLQMNPLLRFIFEARGISTNGWSMSPSSSVYDRDINQSNILLHQLMKLEKSDSPLGRLKELTGHGSASDKTCETLRQLSIAALNQIPVPGQQKSSGPSTTR